LNRENAKELEFREIIESRILRIFLDSTGKSILRRDPLLYIFFVFFLFSFRVFVIQSDQQNNSIMLLIARKVRI